MNGLSPYRLPKNVVPERYDIFLAPDLEAKTFFGSETVTVKVLEPVSEIWLNALELNIGVVSICDSSGRFLQYGNAALDEATERCRISFAAAIEPGVWKLRLGFRGILNNKLHGFYLSTYKDQAGAIHTLASTQLEDTHARNVFPCWDEPAFKAVFSVTLEIDQALTAVSNTAPVSENASRNKKKIFFGDTIRMSTYLVAFAVGEFEASETLMVGRTPLRILCTPGKKHLTAFAQSCAAAVLKFFEEYYGVPYPGDKLDLIAIPDFAVGAMENLGLITCRETALLVDETKATHAELERVADIVAHEVAHMWFGDLVTMEWWNGIWLNEAFATFMEMLAVDHWKPEWQRWTSAGISRAAAFAVDGLHSTRTVEYPVESPKDAGAMFDVLTYEKGASVLRMLEQYLGPDVFREGVRNYIREYSYGSTTTVDLWNSISRASGKDIAALMNAWIFSPGYPIVSARLEGRELVLEQQRFTYLPGPLENVPGRSASAAVQVQDQKWQIPIQIRIDRGGETEIRRALLTERKMRITLPDDFGAVVINEGGHGYYRVRYSAELLDGLFDRLQDLSAIERFNLVGDAWASTVAGLVPIDEYLDFARSFRDERSRSVWAVMIASFERIERIIEPGDRPGFERVVQGCVREAATNLGWTPGPGEDELTGQLRGELLLALGVLGNDVSVQKYAEDLYRANLSGSTEVDPDVLRALVYILAAAGDRERYEEFLTAFRTAKTPQEEQRFLYALTRFQSAELVDRTLEKTINGEIRTQDAPFVLRSMLLGTHSRERAWNFISSNWDEMKRKYPESAMRRMAEGLQGLATSELERSVHAFFTAKRVNFGGKALEQRLEELRCMVALREMEGEHLSEYFYAYLNR